MSSSEVFWPQGEWSGRVAFSTVGGFAYRPGEVLVPTGKFDEATGKLANRAPQVATQTPTTDPDAAESELPDSLNGIEPDDEEVAGHRRLRGVVDVLNGIEELRADGIPATPNHVLFSHCLCCGGQLGAFAGYPYSANPYSANPYSANPYSANPYSANPYSANPYSANPYSISPFAVLGEASTFRKTGWRPHSAHPASPPELPAPLETTREHPVVVVVDTGLAADTAAPKAVASAIGYNLVGRFAQKAALEDWDLDEDHQMDPIAGHGTFIAGIIQMIAPSCPVFVQGPLSGYGDISEHDLTLALEALLTMPQRPDIVNLSLGGYAVEDMSELGQAVQDLHDAGVIVVASAGNDATCRRTYPAALPGVIAVGALGPYGPAPFTNYGEWVRACSPGMDVVSTFFNDAPSCQGIERFHGWARWSGTSFAAPAVVGALARAMCEGLDKTRAVKRLIDDPGLFRIPGLGAVVNQTPWWRKPDSV